MKGIETEEERETVVAKGREEDETRPRGLERQPNRTDYS